MTERISLATALGRQVRAALAEQGMSQTELASALGVSMPHLSRRITGRVAFRGDELYEIAEHLGVDIARLYQRMPDREHRVRANAPHVPEQRETDDDADHELVSSGRGAA